VWIVYTNQFPNIPMGYSIANSSLADKFTTEELQQLEVLSLRRKEIYFEIQKNLGSYNPNFQKLCKEGRSVERKMNKIFRLYGIRVEKYQIFYL
jgi:hypothetical protein